MLPFIDLGAQRRRLGHLVDDAILRVVNHGQYIMGPEVGQLEAELSAFCGARHVVSCANGTDAIAMVLMAKGVKPGDAILCPSFTFAATAEVVAWLGATPVFVDIHEDTFNMDPASLEAAIRTARELKLNPVGVIPVDLFGAAVDYDAILPICEREGLWVLCDTAQSFGGSYKGRRLGTFGLATTTSFFPAKPLGCYGDGGAIFTNDDEVAAILRSIRNHGQGVDKYDNVRIGLNGRLDTIQAAVLLEKLKIFDEEIVTRNDIAARYAEGLGDVAITPIVQEGIVSTWAQYTIRVSAERRDALGAALRERGIPTAIYYPKPVHRQTAYRHYPCAGNGLPASDKVSAEVIALPMHPYLDEEVQDGIIAAVREALAK
ncbi:DegT/DnrJ/EryC1/StrS family aminotransferase [Enterovirga sp. CN4-39]|uniref:DegT/DnrJ/EryC1/StrS family aminotransferase n=1 Tax=Enterovirga sp. CN4-39 TaxID=3400910 RepID=UPI003C014715